MHDDKGRKVAAPLRIAQSAALRIGGRNSTAKPQPQSFTLHNPRPVDGYAAASVRAYRKRPDDGHKVCFCPDICEG